MSNLSESALHPVLRIPGGFEEENGKEAMKIMNIKN